jgi:hypothetical protein
MAQSLEQLNQNLKSLEQQAIDLGDKLHIAHQGYRHILAQSASDQMVMACFTLCTEAYPSEFLKLSVSERHQLQAKIRAIAQQMQQDLREVPNPDTPIADLALAMPTLSFADLLALPGQVFPANADDRSLIGDHPPNEEFLILDEEDDASDEEDDPDEEDDASDEEDDPDEDEDAADRREQREAQRSRQIEAELKALFSLESLLSQRQPQLPQNPVEQIGFWHRQIETQVHHCLRQVSTDTNQALQTAKILPSQIPGPILEAASMAEGGESFGQTPHLVRMILEAREKPTASPKSDRGDRQRRRHFSQSDSSRNGRRQSLEDQRPQVVINLITLQLRIAELEFHDIHLITWRNQIRNLLKELKAIAKEYQKKQHQQAIANARVAWRSTWSNE